MAVKQTKSNLPGAGPGRAKGSTNKIPKQLKDMILKALDGAGGVDYLIGRAKDPRTASAFLGLVGKVLPMTIAGEAGKPFVVTLRADDIDV